MNEWAQSGLGLLAVSGATLGLPEIVRWSTWTARKSALYRTAYEASRKRGKPLLVVGRAFSMYGVNAHG